MRTIPTPRMHRLARTLLIFACLLSNVDLCLAADATQPAGQVVTSSASQVSGAAPQLSPDQLNQMVAPIALYPDALVAQILGAATYPTEVVEADRWMQQHANLKGQALAQEVDQQPWDPSVKALTQFPSVLANMDGNLSWTSSLGEAYMSGSQQVLDAVQVMRRRAEQAGNLQSTPQEKVVIQSQTIVIEPAAPDVVYVPMYDPWVAYGPAIVVYPGWVGVPGLFVAGPGISFGIGIDIGLFVGFGWGWHHWGADWHAHNVVFNHATYISHGATFINRNRAAVNHNRTGISRGSNVVDKNRSVVNRSNFDSGHGAASSHGSGRAHPGAPREGRGL